jgi:glycosyltransferase involved in cell wall biosynthesis
MPDPPDVTVVIPTRDRWDLLRAHALRSALGQEGVAVEVVVVDDGSTDGTAAALAAESDTRLRVVRHDHSRGVAAARNSGIDVARGAWIAFLDDDDLWSPRKLRTQLECAQERDADFVFGAAVLVDRQLRVLAGDVVPTEAALSARLLRGNVIPGGCSNVLVARRLVDAVGRFDEHLTYTEDWDLWIRLALSGRPAACSDVLVAHVEHGRNALSRYRPDVVSEFEHIVAKYASPDTADVVRAGRLQLLEWLAHEYLDAGRPWDAARAHLRFARESLRPWPILRAGVVLSGRPGRRLTDWLRPLRGAADVANCDGRELPSPAWLELYR